MLCLQRDCGFFDWHDARFCPRAYEVIGELLDDIDQLYDENVSLRSRGVNRYNQQPHGGDERQRFDEELEAIRGELRGLKRRQKFDDNEANKWRMKYMTLRGRMLLSWILFIVVVAVLVLKMY